MLKNKYVAAGIGILLILVIAYNIKFFLSKNQSPEIRKAERSEAVKSPESKTVQYSEIYVSKNFERILEQEDKNKWKRDPFSLKSASKKPESGEEIRLMGIIKRDGKSLAMISGKVYKVNDKIGNSVIKNIKKHSIILYSDGNNKEISFEDYIILKEKTK
jgi:Tfp pilus assembly protein PilP